VTVPTLTELFTPLTRDQVVASMIGVAQDLSLPVTAWQSGSVGREILEIVAQQVANQSQTGAVAAAGGLLSYATGLWLTLVAYENWGVTRTAATPGTGDLHLTNTSGVVYTLAAGDVRGVNRTTGATYTSTTGGTLNSGGGTLTVTLVADEPGTDSNASAGEIDSLVTPLLGVTVTNPDPIVGTNEMSDSELVALCRESMAKASPNGPQDAYSYYAKTTERSDGVLVGVTRVTVVQGNGTNYVYLASADGIVEATDVALVNTRIQENVVPTGFTAVVASAAAQSVDVTATVYLAISSTLTNAEAQALILAKLQEYFATIPVGGFSAGLATNAIFNEAIIGQIFQAIPGQIVQVELTSPLADVGLGASSVAVLASSLASFTIVAANS
jgi:hypothetical protein